MKTAGRDIAARRRRYARLTAPLARLGLILQGTITPRRIRADKKRYGPYYQWTWKRQGKTVTVNLAPAQAKAYQKAITAHRQLERRIAKMRALSRRILEATTQGVRKRNRLRRYNTAGSLPEG